MLNIPVEVKELLKTDSTPKNFRVIFPNGERADIINNNIVAESVHFTESVMSQDKFKLGLCESPVIEFEVFGIENIKGKKIECYYEIYCDDTVEDAVYREDLDAYVYPIPLGVFYVDSCKKEARMNIRQVIAYGLQAYAEWRPLTSTTYYPCDITDYITTALQDDVLLSNMVKTKNSPAYELMNQLYAAFRDRYSVPIVKYPYLYHTLSEYFQYTFTGGKVQFINGGGNYKINTNQEYLRINAYLCRYSSDYGLWKFTKINNNNEFLNFYDGFVNDLVDLLSAGAYKARKDFESNPVDISFFQFVLSNNGTSDYRNSVERYIAIDNLFYYVGSSLLPTIIDMRLESVKDYVVNVRLVNNAGNNSIIVENKTLYEIETMLQKQEYIDYSQARTAIQNAMTDVCTTVLDTEWLNGENNRAVRDGVYSHDIMGITVNNANQLSREEIQEYVEDILETQGKLGRFNRDGNFEAFTIDTDTLVPNNTNLVPSESLVPNGADVDTITPSEYETAWYDDELSLPYGACAANHKVSGTDTYTIVYADGYDADTDPSTYQIYDISNNNLIKEMTVEEITPILTTIITNISNLQYMPSDIDMVGRPDIEAGDGIQVMSNSGAFNTYVLSRTIDGIQGLSDTITAK